jgi:hypothetical protein
MMADEALVLDAYAFANERMRADLAACADHGVFLDFDECADFRVFAHAAAIQIHKIGVQDLYPLPQAYVTGNRHRNNVSKGGYQDEIRPSALRHFHPTNAEG